MSALTHQTAPQDAFDTIAMVTDAFLVKFGDRALNIAIQQMKYSSNESFNRWALIVDQLTHEQCIVL